VQRCGNKQITVLSVKSLQGMDKDAFLFFCVHQGLSNKTNLQCSRATQLPVYLHTKGGRRMLLKLQHSKLAHQGGETYAAQPGAHVLQLAICKAK
jgi:hypothetical protein